MPTLARVQDDEQFILNDEFDVSPKCRTYDRRIRLVRYHYVSIISYKIFMNFVKILKLLRNF
jgi:hypothetical protein